VADALQAVVDALYVYPIKACAGVRFPVLQFSENGRIAGDREWVVVNAAQEVVWQGSHPRLALVQPRMAPGVMHLSGPDGQALTLTHPPTGIACPVKIWNSSLQQNEVFEGVDAGDAASSWLRHVTGTDLRLIWLAPKALVRETVNHCHIASAASLAALNVALEQRGHSVVAIERFRPNIVIAETAAAGLDPFVEDYCTRLQWQDAARAACLDVRELCIRCIVPNVNPRTAAVGDQPLETVVRLSAERHPGKPAYFGIYAHVPQAATLHVGAQLELTLNF
jgi:uncharacterized protein YcbX